MFHPLSLIIPALALLPNLFFFMKQDGSEQEAPVKEPVPLVILEKLGQLGVFVGPLFFRIDISGAADIAAVAGMGLMLGAYYYCWFRYFRGGGRSVLLYSPLFSIPVPLAVSPVIYFLLSSVILDSWIVFASSLVLAAGHISISRLHDKAISEVRN